MQTNKNDVSALNTVARGWRPFCGRMEPTTRLNDEGYLFSLHISTLCMYAKLFLKT